MKKRSAENRGALFDIRGSEVLCRTSLAGRGPAGEQEANGSQYQRGKQPAKAQRGQGQVIQKAQRGAERVFEHAQNTEQQCAQRGQTIDPVVADAVAEKRQQDQHKRGGIDDVQNGGGNGDGKLLQRARL